MGRRQLITTAAALVGLAGLAAGCSSGPSAAERASSQADALAAAAVPDTIEVASPNFDDGAPLPERFSCDGTNINPALTWSSVPAEADSVALVVDDPDAPQGTYVHWVVYGIAPDTVGVAEDAVPADAVEARNSNGDATYRGACPPEGAGPHTYRFTVYALSGALPGGLGDPADLEPALEAIAERAVAKGEVVATFGR